jgi:hypothetical protein
MRIFVSILSFSVFVLAGCKTNDFKVAEALRKGMSQAEARTTITAYGFKRSEFLIRPPRGWTTIQTVKGLPKLAHAAEELVGVTVGSAEYYPVGHGLMGWGDLFLFYDTHERLVHFYRVNIN